MTTYFGRVYKLDVGSPEAPVRTFDGFPTATNTPFQIQFTVNQTPNALHSYAEITIYGLNKQSRKAVYERYSQVQLQAGYQEAYGTIFEGQIENVEIGRSGPDVFVKLFCNSAADQWRSVNISKSWGENTPQENIIRDVAESFGRPVEFIGDFSSLPRALKGKTFDRSAWSAMNALSRSFGFEWWVENGGVVVALDEATRPGAVPFEYSPTTGLIGSPEITEQGVDIEVLLNPFVRPRDLYTVESETGQLTFNGIYYQTREFPDTNGEGTQEVLSLVHEGDFYGDRWMTSLKGRRTGGN